MGRPRDERQKDLLQPALDQIIDLKHPLVPLGDRIAWDFLDKRSRTVNVSQAVHPFFFFRTLEALMHSATMPSANW